MLAGYEAGTQIRAVYDFVAPKFIPSCFLVCCSHASRTCEGQPHCPAIDVTVDCQHAQSPYVVRGKHKLSFFPDPLPPDPNLQKPHISQGKPLEQQRKIVMPNPQPQTLTTHLLDLDPHAFETATQHPFLRLAGQSRLPSQTLLSWLLQDRLYALSYISFIGALLAKIDIPTTQARKESIEWRITELCIDALVNIKREVGLFEDILGEWFGWGKGEAEGGNGGSGEKHRDRDDAEVRRETRCYQDLFAGAGASGQSLLVGLTVLWATEKCYLEAWRFARAQRGDVGSEGEKQEQGQERKGGERDVLRDVLIPNWSSEEFEEFVVRIGGLVDELAKEVKVDGREMERCENAWRQVVWCEERFWPEVKE